jgi:hypothetical protein
MNVTFTRTGERRYSVRVEREREPRVLVMDPAPGFDAFLPHDLLHFLVESELGIASGIFGQLAQGGDAGTFRPAERASGRSKRRGERLRRAGKTDAAVSEMLTHEVGTAWRKRTSVRGELQSLAVRVREVALLWRAVEVGGSLTLTWPSSS